MGERESTWYKSCEKLFGCPYVGIVQMLPCDCTIVALLFALPENTMKECLLVAPGLSSRCRRNVTGAMALIAGWSVSWFVPWYNWSSAKDAWRSGFKTFVIFRRIVDGISEGMSYANCNRDKSRRYSYNGLIRKQEEITRTRACSHLVYSSLKFLLGKEVTFEQRGHYGRNNSQSTWHC